MIKVEAIIRETKFTAVKDNLEKIGINSFSYWDVGAVSKEEIRVKTYRGVAMDADEIKRVFVSIVLNNGGEEPVVKSILESAKTGDVGDGKVFIININETYSIRTGDKGEKTLKAFIQKIKESKPANKMQSFYDKFK